MIEFQSKHFGECFPSCVPADAQMKRAARLFQERGHLLFENDPDAAPVVDGL
jgi:hypothetical protein